MLSLQLDLIKSVKFCFAREKHRGQVTPRREHDDVDVCGSFFRRSVSFFFASHLFFRPLCFFFTEHDARLHRRLLLDGGSGLNGRTLTFRQRNR